MLHRVGALKAMMQLRRYAPGPSTVSIVTYHHVADEDPAYPYDRGVADATPHQFRRQMELLARWGTPIGIDDLIRATEGAPLPTNPVMVTFDDGYRSCHDVVLPILRAVGMRATFFVATGYVSDRKLYWWERIAIYLNHARVETATMTYPRPFEVRPREPGTQRELSDLIKDTPNLDVTRFLDELAKALRVDWTPEVEKEHAANLIMTWDHVRSLSRAGMDVESHSRWHRVLQTLDDNALRDELDGSKRDLEAQLGKPCRAIAYPVGRRISHVQRIREAIVRAGYRLGLTNASGATRIWPSLLQNVLPTDRLDISRLQLDREMSDAMYLTQLAVPQFAYIGRHEE